MAERKYGQSIPPVAIEESTNTVKLEERSSALIKLGYKLFATHVKLVEIEEGFHTTHITLIYVLPEAVIENGEKE